MEEGGGFSDESWAFALALYAVPGVAPACLRLQSAAGVDVMFLLAILFAAARKNIVLTPADIAALDQACRPWREQVVHPLRAIRTTMKAAPYASHKQAEALRSRIKADELRAEQIENALLGDLLSQRPGAAAPLPPGQIAACLGTVVHHFDQAANGADLTADIAVLLKAEKDLLS